MNFQVCLIKYVKSVDIDQIWKVEEDIHRQTTNPRATAGKTSLEHLETIINKTEHISPLADNKAVSCPHKKG